MCLIIIANDLKSLSFKDLETAYNRNSDGLGVMYLDKKNNFIQDKFVPKDFTQVKNFINLHKDKTDKMAIHFRFTTQGETNKKNCHPFISYQKNNRTIGMMHNGARLPIPLIHMKCSDTWHFNQHYLKSVLKDNPNVLLNSVYQKQLGNHIDDDKMVFLDSQTSKFIIINEELGNYKGANWYSNTYWQNTFTTSLSKPYSSFGHLGSIYNDYDFEWEHPTKIEDLETDEEVYDFVDNCVDNGNLYPIYNALTEYRKKIAS